jgi:hypothetical protein
VPGERNRFVARSGLFSRNAVRDNAVMAEGGIMSEPDRPTGPLRRFAELWDGATARGWGERVRFWLALLVIFGPMPVMLAFGGWILAGFWGAVVSGAFGCLVVAGFLTGVTGNVLETGCFTFLVYVLLVLLLPAAFKIREAARKLREQRHLPPPSSLNKVGTRVSLDPIRDPDCATQSVLSPRPDRVRTLSPSGRAIFARREEGVGTPLCLCRLRLGASVLPRLTQHEGIVKPGWTGPPSRKRQRHKQFPLPSIAA